MRWSVVRLIAGKETRDLLRDRRSVFITILMPMILYPLFGLIAWGFAATLLNQTTRVVVVGAKNLDVSNSAKPFPTLLNPEQNQFADAIKDSGKEVGGSMTVQTIDGDEAAAQAMIRDKKADVVLVVPEGFATKLEKHKKPKIRMLYREGDDQAKVAQKRVADILAKWESQIRKERFKRANLSEDFDKQIVVEDQNAAKPIEKKTADELRDMFSRMFPLILVMWMAAGAMQPAVDLTAGEKERGTMETLLISPSSRTEIVLGKFIAVTFFAFFAAVWNAVWLTVGGFVLQSILGFPVINLPGMLICIVFSIPLAMLYSSLSLALGVFARSSKEGQYYLIPLMLVTMPLAFYSMMPGLEPTLGSSLVPVTGALLFQQKMLSVRGDGVPWELFPVVFGALMVYVAASLALAIWQFKREGVLFREMGPKKTGLGLFARWRKGT